jgi:hypothetical protein
MNNETCQDVKIKGQKCKVLDKKPLTQGTVLSLQSAMYNHKPLVQKLI